MTDVGWGVGYWAFKDALVVFFDVPSCIEAIAPPL